jgi:Zn finger protein HypA/HybF involved in hydrogenase expression
MHEASIAKYTYDIIDETIKSDPALSGKKIKTIRFDLSEPYTVFPDSFEFYFTELVKNTPMEDSKLEFNICEKKGFFVSSIEVDE